MIVLKSARELEIMKEAGRISAGALMDVGKYVKPGVSTLELDEVCYDYIKREGAEPNFLHLYDFPNTACISVNDEIIHGIPSKDRILKEGDIVSVDVGAYYKGFHGDCAATFPCGTISADAQRLIDVTKQSFFEGIRFATRGHRVSDISHAIQTYVESNGFSVVRSFVGHGVGAQLHEEPEVPNFGSAGRGPRLLPGMTLAIEPMVNVGTHEVHILKDGWTVLTNDGKLSAHYENTVLITDGEPEILTVAEGL